MRSDLVSFLTDYGRDDVYVGVCHAVIAREAPQVRVVDITHAVAPFDVRAGALLLARAVVHFPACVHLAVVDPGVGTARRGVVVEAERGDLLVGPDNGLLLPAARALGGARGAWVLPTETADSATFHGRDVFAPAAAALASGRGGGDLGVKTDPATLVDVATPAPRVTDDGLVVEVVLVDRYGNLQLGAVPGDITGTGIALGDLVDVTAGGRKVSARYGRTFGDVASGALELHPDSDGQLAIAVNAGSAAERLAVRAGDEVTIRPRRGEEAT